eukprot:scaffold151811_cov23-Tisochrysis_lutea.AAC.1
MLQLAASLAIGCYDSHDQRGAWLPNKSVYSRRHIRTRLQSNCAALYKPCRGGGRQKPRPAETAQNGYPGELDVCVTYRLACDKNELMCEITAVPSGDATPGAGGREDG